MANFCHAQRTGGDLSGHQGHRVPVFSTPRGSGQMPPMRRRGGGNAERVLLSGQLLQICYLEKQQVVGGKKTAAHQSHCGGAPERWPRPCDGPLFGKDRQDLRCCCCFGGYGPVRQLQHGLSVVVPGQNKGKSYIERRSVAIHGEHENGTGRPRWKEGYPACRIPRRSQPGPGI